VKAAKASAETVPSLSRFIAPREYRAASFSSRLQSEGRIKLPDRKTAAVWIWTDEKEQSAGYSKLCGAIMHTHSGLLLPLFHEDRFPPLSDIRKLCDSPGKQHSLVYCILGRKEEVLACEAALQRPVPASRSFYLMTRECDEEGLSPSSKRFLIELPGLVIRRIQADAAELFFPLEKAYQLEEVLTAPHRYNEKASFHHFRNQCRSQLIYGAWINGRPVAKAGSNALGFQYAQVGGVFTHPDYRGKGIAGMLMNHLMKAIYGRGMNCTLFVRDNNQAALALYRSLGFRIRCPYRIAYPS
jgi:uncharacterized protein